MASYLYVSQARHRENPEDRVTPTVAQMARGMYDAVMQPAEEDEQTAAPDGWLERVSRSMLWKDTKATSRRFFYSMVLLIPAVLLGLHMGLFPYVGAFFLRFVLFFDKIVALSLLPILFIAFGIDELAKIMLIVIGVTPTIILDTFNLTRGVPAEQMVKAFTLGAGDFDVAYRVVLKQIAPRVFNDPAKSEGGDAVPVCRRNDRFHRRAGLPDRAAAPAHGNGRDHSVRAVGGAAAVPGGPRDAGAQSQTASLVYGGLTRWR